MSCKQGYKGQCCCECDYSVPLNKCDCGHCSTVEGNICTIFYHMSLTKGERGVMIHMEDEHGCCEMWAKRKELLMTKILVGSVRKLKRDCLGNPAGTIGVCYELYNLGSHQGASFILPNGRYDGFSISRDNDQPSDIELFFDDKFDLLAESVMDYQFTNVMKLSQDFDKGYFTKAFVGL